MKIIDFDTDLVGSYTEYRFIKITYLVETNRNRLDAIFYHKGYTAGPLLRGFQTRREPESNPERILLVVMEYLFQMTIKKLPQTTKFKTSAFESRTCKKYMQKFLLLLQNDN